MICPLISKRVGVPVRQTALILADTKLPAALNMAKCSILCGSNQTSERGFLKMHQMRLWSSAGERDAVLARVNLTPTLQATKTKLPPNARCRHCSGGKQNLTLTVDAIFLGVNQLPVDDDVSHPSTTIQRGLVAETWPLDG